MDFTYHLMIFSPNLDMRFIKIDDIKKFQSITKRMLEWECQKECKLAFPIEIIYLVFLKICIACRHFYLLIPIVSMLRFGGYLDPSTFSSP